MKALKVFFPKGNVRHNQNVMRIMIFCIYKFNFKGCIAALEKLGSSKDDHVKKMAKGALWQIQGKGEKEKSCKHLIQI